MQHPYLPAYPSGCVTDEVNTTNALIDESPVTSSRRHRRHVVARRPARALGVDALPISSTLTMAQLTVHDWRLRRSLEVRRAVDNRRASFSVAHFPRVR